MKDINLYFIRHGQTEWNLADRLQGVQNSPLTSLGINEAKITGKYLSDIPFTKAYSSELQRAIETRDYILNKQEITYKNTSKHILSDLTEMDYGSWDGKFIPKLKEMAEFQIFLHEPELFDGKINHGESYFDVLIRMQRAIDTIINESPETGNILIVSHGNVLRLILCILSGKNWKKHRDDSYFPKLHNTSISAFNYKQESETALGTFTTKFINSIAHLK